MLRTVSNLPHQDSVTSLQILDWHPNYIYSYSSTFPLPWALIVHARLGMQGGGKCDNSETLGKTFTESLPATYTYIHVYKVVVKAIP